MIAPAPDPNDPIKVRRILAFLTLYQAGPIILVLAGGIVFYGLPVGFAEAAIGYLVTCTGWAWQAYLSAAKRMEK